MTQAQQRPWCVLKFGGTSVVDRSVWDAIATIIRDHLEQGYRPVVVCSAPSGVSNLLEKLIQAAAHGQSTQPLTELFEKFKTLVKELGISEEDFLQQQFTQLQKLLEGIALLGEVTPRVHAKIMAFGELWLTHLGASFLNSIGIKTQWQDARDCLLALNHDDFRHPDAYLSAVCLSDALPELSATLAASPADVLITQGFIARNERGETVLLGRGGSDSSAAYFAAKLSAAFCEIWTDVPGIYTANPHHISEARLISELSYDEAQELASMGAKVLHPKCIAPVARHHIPLWVKYTKQPKRQGTLIHHHTQNRNSRIKSILTKHELILISIETIDMWHQVGFLAEVFDCFKKHGISIDLISTSQTSITVSLDKNAHPKDHYVLDALLKDLGKFSRASLITPCASVSLVGRNIRAILPELGNIFALFEEQKIYLLSQAANDLNLTFVVDEDQALRLAAKLHHLLIEQQGLTSDFHLSWAQEFGETNKQHEAAWWENSKNSLLKLAAQTPCYVYSARAIRHQVEQLLACDAVDQFFYSLKANNHPEILKLLNEYKIGFECVSLAELRHLLTVLPKLERNRILFTPNFAPKEEYQSALAENVYVTLDNLFLLEKWGELFLGREVFIRIDLGQGHGHHRYVVTGGDQSKFGIPLVDLPLVQEYAKRYHIHVIGLHSHAGSGILNAQHWRQVLLALHEQLPLFPEVRVLNIGGGLGIAERRGAPVLDLSQMNQELALAKRSVGASAIWMEPGRYFVAPAGVLLAKVTQIKQKSDLRFVGIETGMNSLIRPMLYGAYHEIVNLTRLSEPSSQCANIVGPICESGDTLGYSRWLPACETGDVILLANVGAYGRSMSSCYNLRAPAEEFFLND